jgi:hypothetical protein
VTYVRMTRDQRGYENTFLLHEARLGERPRVLYWYRTAPGVRVGRAALDEDAIRGIEEQHPEIDFDWPQLLDEASTAAPEVERRPERRRRPARAPEAAAEEATASPERIAPEPPAVLDVAEPALAASEPAEAIPAEVARNTLLEQLVGREIAQRLRARYLELSARIAESDRDEATRAALLARADALNPDRWVTVEAVLHGVEHADRMLDELRRDL